MIRFADTHNDCLGVFNHEMLDKYLYFQTKCGIKHLVCSIYYGDNLENIFEEIEKRKGFLVVHQEYNTLLHIEDLSFIKNTEDLNRLIALRPFSCSLTWNNENNLAGGSYSKKGLTEFGKYVIKELEKNKIIVDVAHLSKKSFFDFAKITTNPIFCSHTGFDFWVKCNRNLSDDQIRYIQESGGYIGAFCFKKAISKDEEFSIDTYADMLDQFVKKFGVKSLGLGTDFNGIAETPFGFSSYKDIGDLHLALSSRGLKNDDIDCIMLKNFESFLEKIKK